MTRIVWGATGSRRYETGVDRGVLFPPSGSGVPWSGLISVKESPSGGEPQPYYLDGIKYLQVATAEDYDATIDAFSAPPEFDLCDGIASIYQGLFITQQPRKQFGFSYRSLLGNDVDGQEHGYKVHIVYNAMAKATSRSNDSISDSTDPMDLSWDISTVPPPITGFRPSSHLVIDSTLADPTQLTAIENILYGSDAGNSRLPAVSELLTIFGG